MVLLQRQFLGPIVIFYTFKYCKTYMHIFIHLEEKIFLYGLSLRDIALGNLL